MPTNVNLNKRWKEILFAASGLGPNILMTLMMAYFTDAIIPTGLHADINFWSYGGAIIVYTAIFPILWTIGRIFDGIIDIPLASAVDSLRNKKRTKWLAIIVSVVPMIASFVLCWIPIFGKDFNMETWQLVGNSIWIFIWSLVFFTSYTFALVAFYGSLSTVCQNQTQRARVAAYKSTFDTISYAMVFAAIPAFFKMLNIPIWQVAIYLSPLMLTILIPVFMSKKENDSAFNDKQENSKASVPFGKSFVLTMRSKPFIKWLIVNCFTFFALQMFIVSQNALISGVMNLNAFYAAILNTCAFGPVPLMLFIFNKLRKTKGMRFMYQICIVSFAVGVLCFCFGSQYLCGNNVMLKMIIGCSGSVVASMGIAGLFIMPYLIPATIASVEAEVTNKNHAAMYFAIQAFFTSLSGAIASSLLYDYIKLWEIETPEYVWKAGVSIIPIIVFVFCMIAFFLCFFLPKRYTAKIIYFDLQEAANRDLIRLKNKEARLKSNIKIQVNKINKSKLDKLSKRLLIVKKTSKSELILKKIAVRKVELNAIINYKIGQSNSNIDEEDRLIANDSVLANSLLFILTVGLFGIVSLFADISKLKKLNFNMRKSEYLWLICSLFIPFLNIYATCYFNKKVICLAEKRKLKIKIYPKLSLITDLIMPLFLNIIVIGIRTHNFNIISDDIFKKENNKYDTK